jgi:hypothetical protein
LATAKGNLVKGRSIIARLSEPEEPLLQTTQRRKPDKEGNAGTLGRHGKMESHLSENLTYGEPNAKS